MKEILSKTLSNGRLSELLQLAKLKISDESEEVVDRHYLQEMIASATKIDAIHEVNVLSATHAFDIAQRLRADNVIETEIHREVYQKLAPSIVNGLYSVPGVME